MSWDLSVDDLDDEPTQAERNERLRLENARLKGMIDSLRGMNKELIKRLKWEDIFPEDYPLDKPLDRDEWVAIWDAVATLAKAEGRDG